MGVAKAIRDAEALLPGIPAEEGLDPRWQAIIAVGEYIESEPEAVWSFVKRWGGQPQEDLRYAIATCLLEHLLEQHFAEYFSQVRAMARNDPLFAETFLGCWQFGRTKHPAYADQFAGLRKELMAAR